MELRERLQYAEMLVQNRQKEVLRLQHQLLDAVKNVSSNQTSLINSDTLESSVQGMNSSAI